MRYPSSPVINASACEELHIIFKFMSHSGEIWLGYGYYIKWSFDAEVNTIWKSEQYKDWEKAQVIYIHCGNTHSSPASITFSKGCTPYLLLHPPQGPPFLLQLPSDGNNWHCALQKMRKHQQPSTLNIAVSAGTYGTGEGILLTLVPWYHLINFNHLPAHIKIRRHITPLKTVLTFFQNLKVCMIAKELPLNGPA